MYYKLLIFDSLERTYIFHFTEVDVVRDAVRLHDPGGEWSAVVNVSALLTVQISSESYRTYKTQQRVFNTSIDEVLQFGIKFQKTPKTYH